MLIHNVIICNVYICEIELKLKTNVNTCIAFLYMLLLCLYVKRSPIKSQVIKIFTLILINEQLTLTHKVCTVNVLNCYILDNFLVIWWCSKFDDIFTMKKKKWTRHLCLLQTVRLHHVSMLQTGQGGVMWQHTVVFFKGDSR